MKRTLLLSLFSAMLLGGSPLPAAAKTVCGGFVPPNDLNIPVGSSMDRGILEGQFNEVLDLIQKIYGPEVAARGKVLEIRRQWSDGTVNASAMQQGNKYILNMYGGLARHETITMDGFALVACHELGHHLGGAPKVSSWASNEGQSDYYANMKCLKRVFSDPGALAFTRMSAGDEVAEQGCALTYSSDEDRALCVRGAMAGKSVSYLFKALRNETVDPRFDTPDPAVVTAMYQKHPGTQCRMDTYLQGSLCTQPVSAPLSETNPVVGTCTRSNGFLTGFRPLCWYKPSAAELAAPSFGFPDFSGYEKAPLPGSAFSALKNGLPWPGF